MVGSHSVNGVAALHTELLKTQLFRDFDQLWPAKFNNKTNGVTPRRWLLQSNPELARALTEVVGPGWVTDGDELRKLEPLADDADFRRLFRDIKRDNKARLAEIVERENGVTLDLDAIFDVQVKRIHEYKRQLLAILRVAHEYLRMRDDRQLPAGAARLPVRRQGGPRLRHGQADHQAHQLGGRRGQPRPGACAATSRWPSCATSASAWPSASTRRPTSPSRSPPPARRPRAPAT